MAILGGLLGLLVVGSSLNVYSQIALIILIGLSAKNGILIVEFANQLKNKGIEIHEALMQSCEQRIRPVIMTALSTMVGAIPLILSTGAGNESRTTIGVVIFFGLLFSIFLTLFLTPYFYTKVAKYAKKLLQMIPDGYELDDWQRTKIAQISDDISEVYHSLDYDFYDDEC